MNPRWATIIGFAVVSVVVFIVFAGGASSKANDIQATAEANEGTADSAPQQNVVASWAIRDASLEQVRQNGIRNGLLGICAAMLASIAVATALRERREGALAVTTPVAPAREGPPASEVPEA
jgi:hypothetical protein